MIHKFIAPTVFPVVIETRAIKNKFIQKDL